MNHKRLDLNNALILAPMVRASTLPLRLLARKCGAKLAYSDEIIDIKLASGRKQINEKTNTIDFVTSDDKLIFQTCEQDRPLFCQLGTSNKETALKAAKMVEPFVDCIDINLGCTRLFSTQGGMGSSLLKNTEKIREIITHLASSLTIPISCKIRLLDTVEETVSLIRVLISCGVEYIAIHARRVNDEYRTAARWEELHTVMNKLRESDCLEKTNVQFICNGDVLIRDDIEKIRKATGVSAVMIGRGAIDDVSIFNTEHIEKTELIKQYIKICLEKAILFSNAKWTVLQMLQRKCGAKGNTQAHDVNVAKAYPALLKIFGLDKLQDSEEQKAQKRKAEDQSLESAKKVKIDSVV